MNGVEARCLTSRPRPHSRNRVSVCGVRSRHAAGQGRNGATQRGDRSQGHCAEYSPKNAEQATWDRSPVNGFIQYLRNPAIVVLEDRRLGYAVAVH